MKRNTLIQITCLLLLAGGLNLRAASGTWTNDASGSWSGTANWLNGVVADASGSTADFSTINLTANRTVTLDAAHTLTTLKFGDILPDSNWTLSGANTLTLAGTTPTINVLNQSTTISSVIAGTVGLTKAGLGSLTLGGATDTFTGGLKHNAGTLTLDYNASGSPSSTLVPSQALTLGGGALNINGNAGTATSQTFAGATFNAGASAISAAPASGANNPTLTLGAWTSVIGGAVMLNGPATTTYSGGNSVTPTSVSATATITTTTAGLGSLGLVQIVADGANAANSGPYATVGLYDWASTDLAAGTAGTSPYTIIGGSQVTGFYTSTFGANADVPAAGIVLGSGTQYGGSLRFNTPSATAFTPTFVSNPSSDNVQCQGILVTPNMGAQNVGISGTTWSPYYGTTGGKANAIQVWQNNTLGFFFFAAGYYNGRSGASINSLVQNGSGTVVYSGANTQTGPTYLNGGYSVIGLNSHFGAPATAAAVYLNGGTVVASNTLALDNGGGLNPRPITLLGNGGGLAAVAGTTLTVDGQIGSAANTGPLVIGIPASAANGYVAGLLPGTGTGTANTTPVFGTGTVLLNYASGTAGNSQYGGTLITGGATLDINSQYDLGGADQGPTIFNGGTLQYTATLATGTAGTALDISGQPVTLAGNATIDVNGHAVTYANAIGNGGSGALTVASTLPNGILTLAGANNYSGGTTISSGTLRINNTTGSGTGSGIVNIASGGTLGGIGTISGAVTNLSGGHLAPGNGGLGTNTVAALTMSSGSLYDFEFSGTANDQTVVSTSGGLTVNGGAFNLYQPGGTVAYTTTGTYNLIQYTGAIGGTGLDSSWTTASAGNPHIANPQAGLAYAFGTSGGFLTLTISTAGVVGVWNNDADGNWTDGTKWSSNPNVPHSAGDAATFGVGSALRTVTLNANETVGGLFFTNANSFVIANAGNTLTLDNSGGGVNVNVSAGVTNALQTSVALKDNAQITVSAGNSLAISGIVSNGPSVTKTLAINGAGTNILSAANTYGPAAGSTGTTLSGGGILQVANNSALGAGDLSVTANGTLQAGAPGLNVANNIGVGVGVTATVDNNGNALSLGGVISGSGALTKVGNGTLALGGNNTYSGNTTVNAGTLSISSAANVASTPSIILNGGDLLGNGSFTLPNNIGIGLVTGSANTTALIDAAGTFTVNGTIASAGNFGLNSLTVNSLGGSGTLILGGANTFNGLTSISNGVLQVANPLALQNSTLEYDAGLLLFDSSITAATFGGLSGTNAAGIGLTNLSGAPLTLTVGNNNSTTTYTSTLLGSGSLIKAGTGTQTIGSGTSGGAIYTGVTTVNNGTLRLGGVSSLTSAGNLTISGTAGPANLILADAAAVSVGGMVQVLYDGGAGTPSVCSLLVTNNAILTAGSLSYGNGSRLANLTSVTVQGNGVLSITNAFDLNGNIGSTAQTTLANVNGGTLAVGNFLDSAAGATHQAQINFNGGVLQANASDPISGPTTTFLPAFTGLTVYVNAGAGALINPNGYNITIAAPITHGNGTPDGGLTVIGAGTLTLNGANTYTGNTTVTNGTLALGGSGSIATSPRIIVGGGATFDVSALGGFVLGSSQTLSNSSSTATLNGNINTANGKVALTYAAGTPSFSVTNGTLTVPATTTFKVNNTGTALAIGSYKLISTNLNGSGLVTASTLPAVTVGGNGVAGGAGTPALQVNNSELYLVVPSGVNTNPTNLTATVTGSTLSLTWPPDHLGWTLQTNAADLANTNDWFPYPGSASVTNVNITIDPTQTNVFFRMVYP